MITTRERVVAGEPKSPTVGAPKPAGGNRPVVSSYCRCASGRCVTIGVSLVVDQPYSYSRFPSSGLTLLEALLWVIFTLEHRVKTPDHRDLDYGGAVHYCPLVLYCDPNYMDNCFILNSIEEVEVVVLLI
jgi:hypothetical protein